MHQMQFFTVPNWVFYLKFRKLTTLKKNFNFFPVCKLKYSWVLFFFKLSCMEQQDIENKKTNFISLEFFFRKKVLTLWEGNEVTKQNMFFVLNWRMTSLTCLFIFLSFAAEKENVVLCCSCGLLIYFFFYCFYFILTICIMVQIIIFFKNNIPPGFL